jgi:alpha-galactosidase
VNIDDCWTTKSRDASGRLVPDPGKWPNGIKDVVDKIHQMGLKFGLYGCAGKMTCAGYPGSEGHEVSDIAQLSAWGVDFWYVEQCCADVLY